MMAVAMADLGLIPFALTVTDQENVLLHSGNSRYATKTQRAVLKRYAETLATGRRRYDRNVLVAGGAAHGEVFCFEGDIFDWNIGSHA